MVKRIFPHTHEFDSICRRLKRVYSDNIYTKLTAFSTYAKEEFVVFGKCKRALDNALQYVIELDVLC